jgi:hypothetical protein
MSAESKVALDGITMYDEVVSNKMSWKKSKKNYEQLFWIETNILKVRGFKSRSVQNILSFYLFKLNNLKIYLGLNICGFHLHWLFDVLLIL